MRPMFGLMNVIRTVSFPAAGSAFLKISRREITFATAVMPRWNGENGTPVANRRVPIERQP